MAQVTTATQQAIANLYISILGRNPEPAGFAYWCDALANQGNTQSAINSIAMGFSNSPEFKGTYGGQTTEAAIGLMYTNVLNRTADAGGLAYWTGVANNYIAAGYKVAEAYALTGNAIITAAAANTGTADATLIAGKQTAAITSGTSAPTTTYTLTTSPEQISGANITVNAFYDQGAAGSTLTATDSITGTGGSNTLNLTTAGTPTSFNGAQITGIQTINLRATAATGNINLATSAISGVSNFNAVGTGAVQVSGLNSGAAYGLVGNGAIQLGAQDIGYSAAATTATLNIANGVGPSGTTAPTVVIGGAGTTKAVINSTGATNTIGTLDLDTNTGGTLITNVTINATTKLTTGAITAAAATKYTITGAGAVDISAGALAATVTTVDASTNSGGVTIALGTSLTQKVTGGSGNDVITTGGVQLTTGSVDAGSGTADVLDVGANVTDVNTSALAAKYTNFEILRVNGTMNMSLFPTFTAVQLSGATNSITNMTATQAANVQARANIGNTTLTLATATGTTDVLTITAGLGTTTATAVNNATTIGTLTATGFETINLIANPSSTVAAGAAGQTSTLTAITDTSLTAVNLTGTAWTLGDIASTKATTWTATGLTGNGASTPVGLTLSATGAAAAGSIVNGSALRDSITMNSTTGVTFNLGAGNDIFSTTTTLLTPTGAATDNTVNGGDGTSDQLVFTGAATATDTTFTKVTGFESLQLAGGAVDNSVTGLAAGFLSAFATGVTVTDTATQDTAQTYTWASGLYSQNVNLTHTTDAVGVADTANQSITTGAGTDTIVLTATSFTGATAGASQGQITVSTGAGNDTITVSVGTLDTTATARLVTITGGTGADVITISGTNGTAATGLLANTAFVIAAGHSTTTAWDQINGFHLSDIGGAGGKVSDMLDFAAAALNAYVATAASGYSAAELTVAVAGAGANGGLVTFAGTAASGLSLAQKISAVQSVVNVTNGDTCYFVDNGSTYVFNNNTSGDSVVQLVGMTTVGRIITTNDATTDNGLFIG